MKIIQKFFYAVWFGLYAWSVCCLDDQKFIQANQLFHDGKYEQACKLYDAIDHKGFVVLYNLSLAHLYQNNYSQAIVYALRAQKVGTFNQLTMIDDLLDYIYKKIDPDFLLLWYDKIVMFGKKCILSLPMITLQILVLLLLIMLLIFFYQRWYRTKKRVFLWIIGVYSFVLCIEWYKTNYVQQKIGIVIAKTASVYAGPDNQFYKKSQVHESEQVTILNTQNNYYQVRAKNNVGWVLNQDVQLV